MDTKRSVLSNLYKAQLVRDTIDKVDIGKRECLLIAIESIEDLNVIKVAVPGIKYKLLTKIATQEYAKELFLSSFSPLPVDKEELFSSMKDINILILLTILNGEGKRVRYHYYQKYY